jgi:hypothetical protein
MCATPRAPRRTGVGWDPSTRAGRGSGCRPCRTQVALWIGAGRSMLLGVAQFSQKSVARARFAFRIGLGVSVRGRGHGATLTGGLTGGTSSAFLHFALPPQGRRSGGQRVANPAGAQVKGRAEHRVGPRLDAVKFDSPRRFGRGVSPAARGTRSHVGGAAGRMALSSPPHTAQLRGSRSRSRPRSVGRRPPHPL